MCRWKNVIIVKYGVYKNRSHIFVKERWNKNGNKRPCYFCFKDRKNKEIIWFVPISTKYEKYKELYETKKNKSGKRPVYNFVFGNVLGKKAVFLIQNIFPTTVRDNVIITSLRVVELAERGINIPFYDIVKMKNLLLNKQ